MMKQQRQKAERSKAATVDDPDVKVDFKSILKDIQFLGSPHMTWKEKKDLENKKVASLGGKHPKKQRLPLSVARVMMKKQKEREQKELEENLVLRRFGINNGCSSRRETQRRNPEDRVLKSSEGRFRNGVLDVKGLFKPSTSTAVPDEKKFAPYKGMKKKGGNKNKGKKGGRGKRH
ncbi:unnamed protein product [Cuscuta epithymum]|uniref:Uncharacterized protein n=1 Tax=Cuscuta epithymum TaxID=186058 RepID=A0AAV0C9Y1_9ASTE|nr:unnamed protein product [Cuscuta epithymum]CAH9138987.1 unnamed protein product [Cuscuta epithymum]